MYITGQTALGGGICVKRYSMGPLGASDEIIRHIRLRVGDHAGATLDAMGMASCDYSIIDHCPNSPVTICHRLMRRPYLISVCSVPEQLK